MQKVVYWLAAARKEGEKPAKVLDRAVALAGYKNSDAAKLTKDALLRNLDIAEKLGCLDDAGLCDTLAKSLLKQGGYVSQAVARGNAVKRRVAGSAVVDGYAHFYGKPGSWRSTRQGSDPNPPTTARQAF